MAEIAVPIETVVPVHYGCWTKVTNYLGRFYYSKVIRTCRTLLKGISLILFIWSHLRNMILQSTAILFTVIQCQREPYDGKEDVCILVYMIENLIGSISEYINPVKYAFTVIKALLFLNEALIKDAKYWKKPSVWVKIFLLLTGLIVVPIFVAIYGKPFPFDIFANVLLIFDYLNTFWELSKSKKYKEQLKKPKIVSLTVQTTILWFTVETSDDLESTYYLAGADNLAFRDGKPITSLY